VTDIEATLRSLPDVAGLPGGTRVGLDADPPCVLRRLVPGPELVKIPLAYPVARGDQPLAAFLDTWIDLKKKDGAIDAASILGQNPSARTPRWSISRNVLHLGGVSRDDEQQ
jgi:hypothetical protein